MTQNMHNDTTTSSDALHVKTLDRLVTATFSQHQALPSELRLYIPWWWHYTSALKPILTSQSIHATDIAYMNDASEMAYGLDFLNDYFDNDENHPSDSHAKTIFTMFKANKKYYRPSGQVFAACFSERKDDLSQWRAYARSRGGYSLGFSFTDCSFSHRNSYFAPPVFGAEQYTLGRWGYREKLEEHSPEGVPEDIRSRHPDFPKSADDLPSLAEVAEHSVCGGDCYLVKMIYDRNEQRQMVSAIVRTLGEAIHSAPDFEKTFGSYRSALFDDIILRLKHPTFASECEWRIAYRTHSDDIRREVTEYREDDQMGLVPYVALKPYHVAGPKNKQLPLFSVIQGPRENADLSIRALNDFLYAYADIKFSLHMSEVPIRF